MSSGGAGAMPAPAEVKVVPGEEGEGKKKGITPEMLEMVAKTNKTTGLSTAEAQAALAKYGPNVLAEKKKNKLLMFLAYLVQPMAIAIWVAVIIEAVQAGITGDGWVDVGILLFMLLLNALIGFVEEVRAGDAVASLKSKLAPQANVCREGQWHELPARELVPGDLIDLKLGDVIPADAIILDGYNPVEVDQSALTGESLPAQIGSGGHLKMGSMLKTGQIRAVVVATGSNTFFGDAAKLISSVEGEGHLRKVINSIVLVMCAVCVIVGVAILIRLMLLSTPPQAMTSGNTSQFLQSLSVVVVIIVASIPVAIEVVSTSTLAVGSHIMAQKQVIVAKLTAIEELAGMTVLCSDKTGTLTLNQLRLDDGLVSTLVVPGSTALGQTLGSKGSLLGSLTATEGCIDVPAAKKLAALASKRDGKPDAIDTCIVAALSPEQAAVVATWKEDYAIPFDPISKRTIVTVSNAESGARIKVCKGAPQKVLELANANKADVTESVNATVKNLAGRGFRALGLAVCANPAPGNSSDNAVVGDEQWFYVGVIPLFDPPRPDTRHTVEEAIKNGIEVKMITGDQTAIAKETCRQLGMGANILESNILDSKDPAVIATLDNIIMEAHGFAEVMPKHKFQIVEKIRQLGHITGMTGDGVNDAPALKRADIGVAVHGATDAAKAAASIVLTEPGLSVIIDAIIESRKIFQRLRSYFLYRISCTVQILCFFFFVIMCANLNSSYFYNGTDTTGLLAHNPIFSLPVLALVLLTLINDFCCIAVSSDNVAASNKPQKWSLKELWLVGISMGCVGAFSTLILCTQLMNANATRPYQWIGLTFGQYGQAGFLTFQQTQTVIFLQIAVSNMMTLYSARSHGWAFTSLPSLPLGLSFLASFTISTLLSLFWGNMMCSAASNCMGSLQYSEGAVIATFIYCAMWFVVQDAVKMGVYALLERFRPAHEAAIEKSAAAHHPTPSTEAEAHPMAVVEAAARVIAEKALKHGSLPAIPAADFAKAGLSAADAPVPAVFAPRSAEPTSHGEVAGVALAAKMVGVTAARRSLFDAIAPSNPRGQPVDPSRVSLPVLPSGVDLAAVVAEASKTVAARRASQNTRVHVDAVFSAASDKVYAAP